jgi:3-deoxy-7-phosphoheptulonate synthase
MKILLETSLTAAEAAAVSAAVAGLLPGARVRRAGRELTIAGGRPQAFAEAAPALENLPGVAGVSFSSLELCPLACAKPKKVFSAPLDFGRGPVFIAGPCAVEDEASYLASALALQAAGAHALRAALFKPRSSPYAFQGIGWAGLRIIRKARLLTGLPLVTEATDTRQVSRLAEACDVLQAGARNMRNYELLKELARSGRPVLLKRGLRATLTEWLLSAEYLLAHGAKKLILCERGDSLPSSGRQPLDFKTMAAAKKLTGLPVLADPSHASRDRALAAALARRALRAGADGLLIEASLDPLAARIDGRHTISIETFRKLTGN